MSEPICEALTWAPLSVCKARGVCEDCVPQGGDQMLDSVAGSSWS